MSAPIAGGHVSKPMKEEVLDAGPMIAYLSGESGASVVKGLLDDPEIVCYAHAANMCEVFYEFLRRGGEAVAQAVVKTLLSDGVVLRSDMDPDFWREVGRIKIDPGKVSLADCFLLAFAQRIGAEVVTTDHHEFDRLVPLGRWIFRFIR